MKKNEATKTRILNLGSRGYLEPRDGQAMQLSNFVPEVGQFLQDSSLDSNGFLGWQRVIIEKTKREKCGQQICHAV